MKHKEIERLIASYRNSSVQLKATIWYLIANIAQKGIAFLTSPIYTRILTTEQFGEIQVYLSWVSLFGVIAMFCLSMGVFNNGMIDYKNDRSTFSFSTLTLGNIITLIFVIVFILLYRIPFISKLVDMNETMILLMFLYFLFEPARELWTSRQRFEYKYKLSSIINITLAVVSPALAITFILLGDNSHAVDARLIGSQGTFIIAGLFFYIVLFKQAKGRIKQDYWKYAFTFNIFLIPHYLSMYVLNSSDRLMVSYLRNNTEAALYSLAYIIGYTITIVWSAINSSITPLIYEKCEKNEFQSLSKTIKPILIVYTFACLCLVLLGPECVKILATDAYVSSVYVIPPIVGGVYFLALYHLFANVLYYYKRPYLVMISSFVSALLNILLNYLFIPKYGFVAAGYTTLACYMIQALLDYLFLRKIIKQSIFSFRFLILLTSLVLAISFFIPFLYDKTILRIGFIANLLSVAFIFRVRIIAIFKKAR